MHDTELAFNDPELETALEELYRKKWLAESLQAQIEQEEFARACRQEARSMEGFGAVRREIHAFAYHDWGQKLGSYECWRDSGFLKYFDRIAPECSVKSLPTRPTFGFQQTGFYLPFARTEEHAPKRFTKNYGAASESKRSHAATIA